MDGIYNELLEAFGRKAADEMIMYIIAGWSVDAAIQEVVCKEFEGEDYER